MMMLMEKWNPPMRTFYVDVRSDSIYFSTVCPLSRTEAIYVLGKWDFNLQSAHSWRNISFRWIMQISRVHRNLLNGYILIQLYSSDDSVFLFAFLRVDNSLIFFFLQCDNSFNFTVIHLKDSPLPCIERSSHTVIILLIKWISHWHCYRK